MKGDQAVPWEDSSEAIFGEATAGSEAGRVGRQVGRQAEVSRQR